MKQHDAFALKDFDFKRILSRPYFKDLELPTGDDDEILNFFDVSTLDSVALMEKKLIALHKLDKVVKLYRRLVENHRQRLRKLFSKYDMTADENSKIKLERVAKLLRRYNWFEEVIELFNLKFDKLYVEGEKTLDAQYRREFSGRLKKARQSAKLTQLDVALNLNSSPNKYASYEQNKTAPSIETLIRICKLFNVSADKLLGLS